MIDSIFRRQILTATIYKLQLVYETWNKFENNFLSKLLLHFSLVGQLFMTMLDNYADPVYNPVIPFISFFHTHTRFRNKVIKITHRRSIRLLYSYRPLITIIIIEKLRAFIRLVLEQDFLEIAVSKYRRLARICLEYFFSSILWVVAMDFEEACVIYWSKFRF